MPKNTFESCRLTTEQVEIEYQTNLMSGLSKNEADLRLKKYGLNEFESEEIRWWNILLRQFTSPFIYLLVAAALIAGFLGEKTDGIIIAIFVMANASLGFYQEFRSSQALKQLRSYAVNYSKVIRGGIEQMMDAKEIVVGDIVVLETGDLAPADIRIISKEIISVDESILSGESKTVEKNSVPTEKEAKDIYDAGNIVFSGTTITNGKAKGVVVATGNNTNFGSIAHLTLASHKDSIFYKGISQFSKFILQMTIITLILVFLANIIIKGDQANIIELVVFSIALAVSVIPEALPIVTTLSLSRGALHLAKNKVLVKRLSAIEDLGSIEVLCTDKTGTITENKLSVSEIHKDSKEETILYADLAGTLSEKKTEPFDQAISEVLKKSKYENYKNTYKRIDECPFDPSRRLNSVLLEKNGEKILVVRGAPEIIINSSINISKTKKDEYEKWLSEEGRNGKRTFAVASRKIKDERHQSLADLENNLEFTGMFSLADPIKESTYGAVKKAKELGIDVRIITGDAKEVAKAVAEKIELIAKKDPVITGDDLEN
ncbi:cation-transporting P-type ATPase, partial [Candidatus Azambacteria bacterium]|nr:cation-transporting P-type ATPase [Candidatus Azambacteria bacterium]